MALLARLRQFLSPPAARQLAHAAYITLIAQSRKSFFYEKWGVPDTLDGRFEMILLHLFLLLNRLKAEPYPDARELARQLAEVYIDDMDRSLREMGVTDTGVGRRVKTMVAAFYGRIKAYEEALNNPGALAEALRRNVYGTLADDSVPDALQLCDYVTAQVRELRAQPIQALCEGKVWFAESGW